jgi:hypothetical protein
MYREMENGEKRRHDVALRIPNPTNGDILREKGKEKKHQETFHIHSLTVHLLYERAHCIKNYEGKI